MNLAHIFALKSAADAGQCRSAGLLATLDFNFLKANTHILSQSSHPAVSLKVALAILLDSHPPYARFSLASASRIRHSDHP